MVRRFAQYCFVLAVASLLAVTVVRADSTLTFVDGNTVTGSFVYDATTNTIVSFNFTSTEDGGTTFSSASGGFAGVFNNQNGDEAIGFDQSQSYGAIGELDIVLSCGGVAGCLQNASNGNSFALTAGVPACNPTGTGLCLASGQWYSVPECLGSQCDILLAGNNFLTIADPPSTDTLYTLTLSTTSIGTVYAGNNSGNNNGGGNPAVPEPSTLVLSALGFAALALKRACS